MHRVATQCCNAVQRVATQCSVLQRSVATQYSVLQRSAACCNAASLRSAARCNAASQRSAACVATQCSVSQRSTNVLQRRARPCRSFACTPEQAKPARRTAAPAAAKRKRFSTRAAHHRGYHAARGPPLKHLKPGSTTEAAGRLAHPAVLHAGMEGVETRRIPTAYGTSPGVRARPVRARPVRDRTRCAIRGPSSAGSDDPQQTRGIVVGIVIVGIRLGCAPVHISPRHAPVIPQRPLRRG